MRKQPLRSHLRIKELHHTQSSVLAKLVSSLGVSQKIKHSGREFSHRVRPDEHCGSIVWKDLCRTSNTRGNDGQTTSGGFQEHAPEGFLSSRMHQ